MSTMVAGLSPLEKTRAAESLRAMMLKEVRETSDLFGLFHVLDRGLQDYPNYAMTAETNAVRGEIFRGLCERLERDISRFMPKDRDSKSDPKWIIEIVEKLDAGELQKERLKYRIMTRVNDDILYLPREEVSPTLEYMTMLAGRLDITLDRDAMEKSVLLRAQNDMNRVGPFIAINDQMKKTAVVYDFLVANLPGSQSSQDHNDSFKFEGQVYKFGDLDL